MNRWLIIVGLLVVCHADVAVAASRSPSLLERILSVFHLRPTHHAAPRQTAEKVEPPAGADEQTQFMAFLGRNV